jgi:hypothetical protein
MHGLALRGLMFIHEGRRGQDGIKRRAHGCALLSE